MATSLLLLLDDISLLADDVATMSKVAAKKTAGVLGDDIALNAHQVTGFSPSRELPVVLAVAKGSAINKAILVPLALLLLAFAPWALTPLLMLGGAYLCFEGTEKVFHALLHDKTEDAAHRAQLVEKVKQHTPEELVQLERDKIKGAVRTDFILSAEIVAITLGSVQEGSFLQQALVLVAISAIFTIGVYALVAAVVKLDDLGIWLAASERRARQALGRAILRAAPWLMKTLSVVGTLAMFLVGGGIIVHGLPVLHHLGEAAAHAAGGIAGMGGVLAGPASLAVNMLAGLIVGAAVLALVKLYGKLFRRNAPAH